ncbi:hypothetical protein HPB50_006994 [Hyalomma asiaticum]|uniref:Uncharacterized protein n=1 Tax=Hyalomma asiaticum TaxID=266040 RepID=A0ACB7SLM8_HYAAI|nr:hypothetical protein HPB50_006994 [Hyalomma asiaticum]
MSKRRRQGSEEENEEERQTGRQRSKIIPLPPDDVRYICMPVSGPGQGSPWSASRPTESVPLQSFFRNGVSCLPVALVPTDGIRLSESELFQQDLRKITGRYLDIEERLAVMLMTNVYQSFISGHQRKETGLSSGVLHSSRLRDLGRKSVSVRGVAIGTGGRKTGQERE